MSTLTFCSRIMLCKLRILFFLLFKLLFKWCYCFIPYFSATKTLIKFCSGLFLMDLSNFHESFKIVNNLQFVCFVFFFFFWGRISLNFLSVFVRKQKFEIQFFFYLETIFFFLWNKQCYNILLSFLSNHEKFAS